MDALRSALATVSPSPASSPVHDELLSLRIQQQTSQQSSAEAQVSCAHPDPDPLPAQRAQAWLKQLLRFLYQSLRPLIQPHQHSRQADRALQRADVSQSIQQHLRGTLQPQQQPQYDHLHGRRADQPAQCSGSEPRSTSRSHSKHATGQNSQAHCRTSLARLKRNLPSLTNLNGHAWYRMAIHTLHRQAERRLCSEHQSYALQTASGPSGKSAGS